MSAFQKARPHLLAAINKTPIETKDKPTIAEVEADIRMGAARLWLGERSAAVTEPLSELNVGKTYRAALAGGDLDELLKMMAQAEVLARTLGFEQMVVDEGRPGWERALKKHGYVKVTRLVKEL